LTDPLRLLDDTSLLPRRDPRGMYSLALGFAAQCRRALDIADASHLPADGAGISSVVLTGLGGSAAGGDFVRALFDVEGRVPFTVNREYALPAWVGSETLVVATSYSGDTEETLSAYGDARRRGASLLVVSSGGELSSRARSDGVPLVTIPGGQPPRTAMGFMLVPVLVATSRLGLLPAQDIDAASRHVEIAMASWVNEVPSAGNRAKQLAARLHGALGVLYGLGAWQGVVAQRWKGQLNENAKQHVFAHALPEMNHNEILGWEGAGRVGVERWLAILLADGTEGRRMSLRADATLDVVRRAAGVERVQATGPTLLAKMLSLALLGDFVSLYLAALNGVDPYSIDSIEAIKQHLRTEPQPPDPAPGPSTGLRHPR
jgi:glucose/mannose-6-phosphate isomerase